MSLFGGIGSGTAQPSKPAFSFPAAGATNNATPSTSAPASGGLFGATNNAAAGTTTSTSAFGGFGQTTQTGGANTGGTSLFGGLKPQTTAAPTSTLFGGLGGGQNQATGSNAQTSQSGTSGSIFGGTLGTAQTSQPAQSGGLFGGLGGGQKSQPAPSGGLFGGLGGSQTSQAANNGGLLGGLGGSQQNTSQRTQPTQTSSLFGGTTLLGATSEAQSSQPAQSGGLFGGLGGGRQSQPVQTGGAFGSSLLGAGQQSQGQAGLFGKLGQQNTANTQQAATAVPSASQIQAQKPEPRVAYFDLLIERGKKRQSADAEVTAELPSLQLGLGDISRKLRNIGQTGTGVTQRKSAQSRYILSASGVNTAAALRDLSALGAEVQQKPTTLSTPSKPGFDTDLEGYVENLYRQSALDLVEHHLSQSRKDFDSFLEEHVQIEWDLQRQRIYEHFGLVRKGEQDGQSFDPAASVGTRGAFGRSNRRSKFGDSAGPGGSTMQKSVLGIPSMRACRAPGFSDVAEKASNGNFQPAPEDRLLREKQDRYADKIKSLNVARMEDQVYPLLHSFVDVESQPSTEDTSHFVNGFKAVAEMIGEQPEACSGSEPNVIKERHFAKDYLDDSPTSRNAFDLRKRILKGSRTFLEKQFLSNVETVVAKNPREANLGGVPTIISKVRGYIRIRVARKELGTDSANLVVSEDDYIWVLIFYLLRAGLINEANEYAQEKIGILKNSDRHFVAAIEQYASKPDQRLTSDLQSLITKDYTNKILNVEQVDPYKAACYKVVGRCGLGKRNLDGINQSIEDWTWLQFSLAREVNRVEETAAEVFGLEEVRSVVQEIGQRHFLSGQAEGNGAHGTYFFLQILAGQFESAIAWLYPNNYVTAVHFAIALNYYGLLRVNDFNGSDDLLSYTTRQLPQLSFGHMIGYYTRDFRAASPTAAADYLCLIALDADVPGESGKRQLNLCYEALRELVLETREFAQLLGDIRADGQRIKGAIETRLPLIRISSESQFLRQITISAAQIADENSRVTDAVLLYHLAEEYDDVISVCARALSDSIASSDTSVVPRLEPLKPRGSEQDNDDGSSDAPPPNSSLSLTAVTTPADLAQSMLSLYRQNTLIFSQIRAPNRSQVELLLRIDAVKSLFLQRRWSQALDAVDATTILPTSAEGDVSRIRARAQAFDALPQLVVRLGGQLLVWTVRCTAEQRQVLDGDGWGPERKVQKQRLEQVAKDCMVWAGMVRYRLGNRIWEQLGGEALET